MNKTIIGIIAIVALGAILWYGGLFSPNQTVIENPNGTSSSTAQDGEQNTNTPQKPEDLIHVTSPKADDFISSPLTITGEARGYWYFEASFPVVLLDEDGKEIARVPAQAQGEWMTEHFVPFKTMLTFPYPGPGKGTLVFKKDNPSGLPENDAEIRIPIHFELPSATGGGDEASGGTMPQCRPTGCSGQICSNKEVMTTCEYQPEYACYKNATCERQVGGGCGWTQTKALSLCIEDAAAGSL